MNYKRNTPLYTTQRGVFYRLSTGVCFWKRAADRAVSFLFFHRKAKCAQLLAQRKIRPVGKSQQIRALNAKPAAGVDEFFGYVYRYNIGQKHVVRA